MVSRMVISHYQSNAFAYEGSEPIFKSRVVLKISGLLMVSGWLYPDTIKPSYKGVKDTDGVRMVISDTISQMPSFSIKDPTDQDNLTYQSNAFHKSRVQSLKIDVQDTDGVRMVISDTISPYGGLHNLYQGSLKRQSSKSKSKVFCTVFKI
ncbi:unnamed protein product [Mytilus edulis]|uniref:Uncharacterized protein n=1 Tax=Mytilus edulis TaxID=6550 RepID=A0A8S3T7S9_MYTED|nr:unnamed protein product [Mytilus edulis]